MTQEQRIAALAQAVGADVKTLLDRVRIGSVNPEGNVTATPGKLYLRDSGQVYKKASGTGNTDWVELATVGAASGSVSYYNHITLSTNPGVAAWTNMPVAAAEFGSNTRARQQVILTNAVDARLTLSVWVPGSTTAVIYVQYSLTGATWVDMGLSLPINTTGDKLSAFVAVPTAAKGDVLLRLMGSGGDAVADPVLGTIGVGVRYTAPVV